jgi:hypothetical protein
VGSVCAYDLHAISNVINLRHATALSMHLMLAARSRSALFRSQ